MAKPMRIAVVGTSGSGKSTLAQRIGERIGAPVIDLDAINWQPGWHDLNGHDPETFKARVASAAQGEHWVSDGNYGTHAQPLILARATHLVWLDYGRALVMRRVIRRSVARALWRRELWPGTGNVETFGRWFDEGHPIRWAWSSHASNRIAYLALIESLPARILVHHLRHPSEAGPLIARLAA